MQSAEAEYHVHHVNADDGTARTKTLIHFSGFLDGWEVQTVLLLQRTKPLRPPTDFVQGGTPAYQLAHANRSSGLDAPAHELAHATGLTNSTDAESVMFAWLAPGAASRALTERDRALLFSDAGTAAEPEPFWVAPLPSEMSGGPHGLAERSQDRLSSLLPPPSARFARMAGMLARSENNLLPFALDERRRAMALVDPAEAPSSVGSVGPAHSLQTGPGRYPPAEVRLDEAAIHDAALLELMSTNQGGGFDQGFQE